MSVDHINDQYLSDQRSLINEFDEWVAVIERERDKALYEVTFLDSFVDSILAENVYNIVDRITIKKELLESKISHLRVSLDNKNKLIYLTLLSFLIFFFSFFTLHMHIYLTIVIGVFSIIAFFIYSILNQEIQVVKQKIKILGEEENRLNKKIETTETERQQRLIHYKKVNEDTINKINRQHNEKKSKLEDSKFKKLEELKKRYETEKRKLGFVKYRHCSGYDVWGTPEEIVPFVKFDTDIESNFKNISPREFEIFISNLLSLLGYRTEVTSYGKDFGVDVIADKDDERTVVPVKKYAPENKVSNAEIQNLLGSMWRFNAHRAIFATSSDYTDSAREQAENAPIELWDFDKIKKLSLLLLLSGNKLSYSSSGDSWEIYDKFENMQTITCPYCEKKTAVDRNKCENCDRIVISSIQLFNQLTKPIKYLMNELFIIDSNKITYKNDYSVMIKYIGDLEESVNGLGNHLMKYIHFFENELKKALLDRDKVNDAAKNLQKLYLKQIELFKDFRAIDVPSSVTNLHKIVDDVHWKNILESFKVLDQIREIARDPEKFLEDNILRIRLDFNPISRDQEIESELVILKETLQFLPRTRRPIH